MTSVTAASLDSIPSPRRDAGKCFQNQRLDLNLRRKVGTLSQQGWSASFKTTMMMPLGFGEYRVLVVEVTVLCTVLGLIMGNEHSPLKPNIKVAGVHSVLYVKPLAPRVGLFLIVVFRSRRAGHAPVTRPAAQMNVMSKQEDVSAKTMLKASAVRGSSIFLELLFSRCQILGETGD